MTQDQKGWLTRNVKTLCCNGDLPSERRHDDSARAEVKPGLQCSSSGLHLLNFKTFRSVPCSAQKIHRWIGRKSNNHPGRIVEGFILGSITSIVSYDSSVQNVDALQISWPSRAIVMPKLYARELQYRSMTAIVLEPSDAFVPSALCLCTEGETIDSGDCHRRTHCWCSPERALLKNLSFLPVPTTISQQCKSNLPETPFSASEEGFVYAILMPRSKAISCQNISRRRKCLLVPFTMQRFWM